MVCECNPVLDASMQHILTCMDYQFYSEALFAAEKILAENPSDEIIYLIATCLYRNNRPKQAKSFLLQQDSKSPKCKYLLAKCYMDIGCAAEAENVILSDLSANPSPTDVALFYKDVAPFVLLMLSEIYKFSNRRRLAVNCLKKCNEINPLFWTPYKELIDLRENIDPTESFTVSKASILNPNSCLRALSNKINIGDIPHPNCPSKKLTDMHDSQEDLSVSRENVNPQYDENFNDSMHGNDLITFSHESISYSFNRTPARTEPGNNNAERMSTDSFNDCVVPIECSIPSRQKQFASKYSRSEEESDKPKPSFGNIYSGPQPVMHACVPVGASVKIADPPTNSQTRFSAHSSLNSSRKINQKPGKKISFQNIRPPSSTPLNIPRSERINLFNHSTTPISKLSEYNTSIISASPSITDSPQLDPIKSIDQSSLYDMRLLSMDQSSGPRTRSQAKAAAAQKSGHSKKLIHQRDESTQHNKSSCDNNLRIQTANSSKQTKFEQSALNYLQLLIALGKIYKALRQYKNNEVLALINLLPKHQAETSLIYSWQAMAFSELNNKTKACEILALSHNCEPWQLHGMVLYSTLLWKNNNDAQMMSLSNEINELDRDTPEFWCILGNTMSAKKENEVALRFFQRAVQVAPTYAYAYYLLGYEYFEQEEMEKAKTSFKKALEYDSNLYLSYCGIAWVHQHQDNYADANTVLKDALKINPDSCFLLTNLAGIRMKLKECYSLESTLVLLERACQSSPKDPLARYHKAKLLYQLGRYQESLYDCNLLENVTNKEARVYYLMSLNLKQMGDLNRAMVYNTWATERDPKCTNDSFIFDRSFVSTTPVMNIAEHSSNLSSRNTSFPIGARRNSESMQDDPSDNVHHNSDLFASD